MLKPKSNSLYAVLAIQLCMGGVRLSLWCIIVPHQLIYIYTVLIQLVHKAVLAALLSLVKLKLGGPISWQVFPYLRLIFKVMFSNSSGKKKKKNPMMLACTCKVHAVCITWIYGTDKNMYASAEVLLRHHWFYQSKKNPSAFV